jgi:hypothetical protein
MSAAIDADWKEALVYGGIVPGTQTVTGEPLFPRVELVGAAQDA